MLEWAKLAYFIKLFYSSEIEEKPTKAIKPQKKSKFVLSYSFRSRQSYKEKEGPKRGERQRSSVIPIHSEYAPSE